MTLLPQKNININEIPHKNIRKSITKEDFQNSFKFKKHQLHYDIRTQISKETFANYKIKKPKEIPKIQKQKKTTENSSKKQTKTKAKPKIEKIKKKIPTSYFTNIRSFMTENRIFDENLYYNDVSFEEDETFKRATRGRKQNWGWLNEHQKEDQSSKHYKILGIPKTSSIEEIKKQYYKLSMQFHPDRNPDNEDATKKFQQFAESYHHLMNLFVGK